jgi:hypothetical protein
MCLCPCVLILSAAQNTANTHTGVTLLDSSLYKGTVIYKLNVAMLVSISVQISASALPIMNVLMVYQSLQLGAGRGT